MARGLAGSWGTLAVLSEVTFKVLPLPDDVATLVFSGLTDDLAVELMSTALGLPYEVSGTVHLPASLVRRLKHATLRTERTSLTAIRLENFTRSIAYRKEKLKPGARRLRGADRARPRELTRVLGRDAPPLRHGGRPIASVAHLDDAEDGAEARQLDPASYAG